MDPATRTLVERAQRQDAAATDELFERYRVRLLRAVRRTTAVSTLDAAIDCEDLVQDACCSAFRSLHAFEYRGSGSFLAWMLQTTHRALLQSLRRAATAKRSGARTRVDDLEVEPGTRTTPSQVAQGHELAQRLERCLATLPERERAAIVLRRYFDADAAEICSEIGLGSAGAARALLSRAQARLAQLLDDGA